MNRPARLALVTTELREGGAEKCLTELALRIDRAAFEPRVYVLQPQPAAPRDRLYVRLQDAGVPTEFLGLRRIWQLPDAIRRLRRAWTAWQPDLVQSFLFHADVLTAYAARSQRIPHFNLGLRVAEPNRWRGRWERWAAKRADRVVCVSHAVADLATQQWRIDSAQIEVIPNGIEVPDYSNVAPARWSELGLPNASRVLLIIGRLERQKGIDRILPALPPFFDRNPQAAVVIVGEGRERKSLEATVRQLELQQRVIFLGWRNDVPSLLKSAAGLLLASRYEGMPNVVLDAMAAGRPIAAFQVSGLPDLLAGSGNPWVSQDDVKGLMDLAERIVRDRAWADEVGEQLAQIARRRFSLDAMVARYEALYREQLG